MSDENRRVRFHYLKSPAFHTIHADGLIGGLTPRGGIHVALYTERLPIPVQTEHRINEDGSLGPEIRESRLAKEGVIRELLVDVTMDLDTAERIHKWFGLHLGLAATRQAADAEAPKPKAEDGEGEGTH